MSAASQIFPQVTPQSSVVGFPQFSPSGNDANSSSTSNQPFAELIGSIVSALANRSQNTNPTTASALTANLANSKMGSGSPGSTASNTLTLPLAVSGLEQELLKILQQAAPQATKTGKENSSVDGSFAYYSSLVSAFLNNLQANSGSSNAPTAGSNGQVSDEGASSALLAKLQSAGSLGQEMSAFLSGGMTQAGVDSTAAQSPYEGSNMNEQTDANQEISTLVQKIMNDPVVKSDLTRLMSAASNSTSGTTAVPFPEESLPNKQNAKTELVRNSPKEGQSIASTALSNGKSTGNSPNGTLMPEQLSASNPDGSLLRVLKQNLQDLTSSDAKTTVQNTSQRTVQTQITSTGTGSVNTSSTAVATSAAATSPKDSSGSTDSNTMATVSTGSQASNRLDAAAVGQGSQSTTSSSTPEKQDSSKSDNGLSTLIKRGMTEIYPNVSDGSKVDSSFKQTLSAVTQNPSGVDAKPDTFQIAQTIVRGIDMMTKEGKTVVNVKLEPESLGSVVLQVASEDGKISAQFDVRTPDARAYLESSVPQMKQMLQSNGVSLSHLTVNLSSGQSQTRQQQYQSKKSQQKFYVSAPIDAVDATRSFGYNTMEIKV